MSRQLGSFHCSLSYPFTLQRENSIISISDLIVSPLPVYNSDFSFFFSTNSLYMYSDDSIQTVFTRKNFQITSPSSLLMNFLTLNRVRLPTFTTNFLSNNFFSSRSHTILNLGFHLYRRYPNSLSLSYTFLLTPSSMTDDQLQLDLVDFIQHQQQNHHTNQPLTIHQLTHSNSPSETITLSIRILLKKIPHQPT